VLTVDLFEFFRRLLGILLAVQKVKTFVVELVRRLVRDDLFVEQAAGAERPGEQYQRGEPGERTHARCRPVDRAPAHCADDPPRRHPRDVVLAVAEKPVKTRK
jgi:hypothetical protein